MAYLGGATQGTQSLTKFEFVVRLRLEGEGGCKPQGRGGAGAAGPITRLGNNSGGSSESGRGKKLPWPRGKRERQRKKATEGLGWEQTGGGVG
jgi:hypothetical protein